MIMFTYPIHVRSVLILSSHVPLQLPSGFPYLLPYAFLISSTHATCPAHITPISSGEDITDKLVKITTNIYVVKKKEDCRTLHVLSEE